MKLNDREKLLVLIFPACIAFGGYMWGFGNSTSKELASTRQKLEQAEEKAVTPWQVEQQRMQHSLVTDELEETQSLLDELELQADELCGRITSRRKDIHGIHRLTALLERCGLRLTEESAATAREIAGMAASLEEATARLEESLRAHDGDTAEQWERSAGASVMVRRGLSADRQADFRQLEFHGRYADVARVLEQLADDSEQPIPVAITMDEIGLSGLFTNVRRWTLFVRN